MSKDSPFQLDLLRQAMPYIYAHRGKTFVIYVDDKLLTKSSISSLIHDLALVHILGVKLVLVLGLRTLIDKKIGAKNSSVFHDHMRITDRNCIETITEVAGSLKANIEAQFSIGLVNTPMSGLKLNTVSGNFVRAKPVGVRGGIDHQFTGEVRSIATGEIQRQLDSDNIVLLTPMGYSKTGDIFNLSGIDVAMHAAYTLKSEKLIFLLDKFNLQNRKKQSDNHYNVHDARELVKKLPKSKELIKRYLNIAIQACLENVKRVHLIDASISGALLEELYTLEGVATLITAETYDEIQPATINDVGGILGLIQPLIDKGALVDRSREQLELEIENFGIIKRDGMVLACGALHTFPDDNSAEIACLAVHPNYQSDGRGSKILEHLEQEAYQAGLTNIFLLTTQTAHWFQEHGFKAIQLDKLPVKKQALYNYKRNSKVYLKSLN